MQYSRVFVYVTALTFKINHTNNIFDNIKTQFIICVGPHIIYAETIGLSKAAESCFSPCCVCAEWINLLGTIHFKWINSLGTVHVNSGSTVYWAASNLVKKIYFFNSMFSFFDIYIYSKLFRPSVCVKRDWR